MRSQLSPISSSAIREAGQVSYARFSGEPPSTVRRKYTGARADGIRYEKKAQKYLSELYADQYVQSPWIRFVSLGSGQIRWCQPDGILLDIVRGTVTIIEIKSSHTSKAWYQIDRLYLPVLQCIFPQDLWLYRRCEVVRYYDPLVAFPEPIKLVPDLSQLDHRFGVHIFRA